MKKQQHTKGPWRLSSVEFDTSVYAATEKGTMHVSEARGWGHLTGFGGFALSEDDAFSIQRANARLIAAAPELLDIVERLVAYYDHGETRAEAVFKLDQAKAAIAKAKGEEA